jgi:hypothetical protein
MRVGFLFFLLFFWISSLDLHYCLYFSNKDVFLPDKTFLKLFLNFFAVDIVGQVKDLSAEVKIKLYK